MLISAFNHVVSRRKIFAPHMPTKLNIQKMSMRTPSSGLNKLLKPSREVINEKPIKPTTSMKVPICFGKTVDGNSRTPQNLSRDVEKLPIKPNKVIALNKPRPDTAPSHEGRASIWTFNRPARSIKFQSASNVNRNVTRSTKRQNAG